MGTGKRDKGSPRTKDAAPGSDTAKSPARPRNAPRKPTRVKRSRVARHDEKGPLGWVDPMLALSFARLQRARNALIERATGGVIATNSIPE